MSDDFEDVPDESQDADWIKDLRRKASKDLPAARADLEAERAKNLNLERRLAVTEAGIDLTSPVAQLFLKSYDGEATPEAIQLEAAKYGLFTPVTDIGLAVDAQSLAQVAASHAQGASTSNSSVTQDDVAGWTTEQQMRFRKTHPSEWEGLLRGETVNVVL